MDEQTTTNRLQNLLPSIHRFHYMAMSDDRHRYMPLPDDRSPDRGKPLAYPEAILLVNPVEPEFKGEVFISLSFSNQHYFDIEV